MKIEDFTPDVMENGRFTVDGYRGIAFYIHQWAQKAVPLSSHIEIGDEEDYANTYEVIEEIDEWEWIDDPDSQMMEVVMVGDDRVHTVDIAEMTLINEDEYCHECGQIGCGWTNV